MQKHIAKIVEDILQRIDRLNQLIKLHKTQENQDLLAIEGYQKLKSQYVLQLKELLSHEFEIEIHEKVA